MYAKHTAMISAMEGAGFTPAQITALIGLFGQCMLDLEHRGSLAMLGSRPEGATDAVVHIANYPHAGTTTNDTEPDSEGNLPNGWGLWVEFGGAKFDGPVCFNGPLGCGDAAGDGIFALFPVGTILPWARAIAQIPTNWVLMDGVANAAGSGINMGGQVQYGYLSGDPTFGTIGGSISAALTWSGAALAGSSTTSLTIDNNSTAVTVNDHAAHTHSVSINGSDIATVLNDHTYSGNQGDVTAGSTDVAFGGGVYAHSGSGSLGVTSGNPGAALTHTVNNSIHTHTGTVSNSSIAGNFTVNAPATVRPAGKVIAYIEKIA